VRLSEYSGKARYGSEERASIHDVLPMGGLAPDIPVSEVMSSESDLLCYRY
jgi:tyrosinase